MKTSINEQEEKNPGGYLLPSVAINATLVGCLDYMYKWRSVEFVGNNTEYLGGVFV